MRRGFLGVSKFGEIHGPAVQVGGVVPLTFCLNFHPLERPRAVDLFVGPMVASTIYSGVRDSGVRVGGSVGVESGVDLGLGVNAGADINLGKSRWSLNAGIKYIPISVGGSTNNYGRDANLCRHNDGEESDVGSGASSRRCSGH